MIFYNLKGQGKLLVMKSPDLFVIASKAKQSPESGSRREEIASLCSQ
jgi:hypothetical protein